LQLFKKIEQAWTTEKPPFGESQNPKTLCFRAFGAKFAKFANHGIQATVAAGTLQRATGLAAAA
jgi:hypothetical protein